MRSKFSELIEQGVASFSYTPVATEIPCQDPTIRAYNNIFSIPSDTHMSKTDDGRYVITGHMINDDKKWESFLVSSRWGAVDFSHSGYWSVSNLLYNSGLQAKPGILNGDKVCFVEPIPASEIGITMPISYTTTESQIPHPISEISTTGDINKIQECFKENITATVQNLNESLYIKGDNWISYNNDILGYNNGTVYVLKLSK